VLKRGTGALVSFSLTHPKHLLPLLLPMSTPRQHGWDVPRSEVRQLDNIYLYVLRRAEALYPKKGVTVATNNFSTGAAHRRRKGRSVWRVTK